MSQRPNVRALPGLPGQSARGLWTQWVGGLALCEEDAACREADGHQYVQPPGKTLAASSQRPEPLSAGRHQYFTARSKGYSPSRGIEMFHGAGSTSVRHIGGGG